METIQTKDSVSERKMKKQERDQESVTSASSRFLLRRGDLRGTLGHQPL
jgi:hypothetical protein